MLNVWIVLVTLCAGALLMYPRLANARLWRAAITPLASIIGSGFLVLGPVLNASFGQYAPAIMVILCLLAYSFGSVIRFNIIRLAVHGTARRKIEDRLETLASWALAFAYVVSVAYYLNLLGAFAVSQTEADTARNAKLITSMVLILILLIGWSKGFRALERMEQLSVGLKLSIIAGLLFALGWYFLEKAAGHALRANPAVVSGWPALTMVAGLLVTVQGFETSRYLGNEYDPMTRVRSMQVAQWLSTAICVVYLLLLSYVFAPGTLVLDETAIIDMMAIVAPILPLLLITAAISAQFSAAVADTGGSGGLIMELTGGRVSERAGYAALVAVGLGLTWAFSVFEIISYASRAFAVYYALQALIATIGAWAQRSSPGKAVLFASLALIGFVIAIFGVPVE
ncbi:hypothetical protein [Yoonia sediminilitoris]|uniref:APC family permease n=1 Tax=Yoonia sediminilitoris TaxID=1286148 RepID=A0A2T6KRR2_9RHOB|nr:hypothetical protein [Yoonia sediminilitoris]PUB19244.1 hypothetical protein C8N45_101839 [Yoonia sediminilitoris]RCW99412.1 hypothetical protein DFP92_101839 [Yoonia sediminilitoris]